MLRDTARPFATLATGHRPRAWPALVVALVGMLAAAGGAAAATVTEFSAGITAGSRPEGITAGPDGNLWFTESTGNRIGRITPAGAVTEFSAGITAGTSPNAITAGPDGNLWFTELSGGRVGRITPAGVVNEFVVTFASFANSLRGITAGADGNLWYTVGGRIGRITPAGAFMEFTAGITAGSSLEGITAGPDGNVWFTENGGTRVGRITSAGAVTEFPTGIGQNVSSDIAAGADGNLWFTAGNSGGRIGRITLAGAVTNFSAGGAGTLPGIAAGPDGNLWFTTGANLIGRVTLAGALNEFRTGISPSSSPNGITSGPDGNLWFTEASGNRIGRITTAVPAAVPVATTLPKPVVGKLVNVQVVRGQVFVSQPAGKARASAWVPGLKGRVFVPLRGASQIPVRSLLDTRKGTVKLTSARDTTGSPQSSDFLGGVFQVLQSGKAAAKGLTEARLKGSSFSRCRVSTRRVGRFKTRGRLNAPTVRGGRAAAARLSHRAVRRLRGSGSGRFRTRGRYSAATVRGTDWTVIDRCDGTLTKVRRGKVAVRDFHRKKTITVRAGKRYLAAARR